MDPEMLEKAPIGRRPVWVLAFFGGIKARPQCFETPFYYIEKQSGALF